MTNQVAADPSKISLTADAEEEVWDEVALRRSQRRATLTIYSVRVSLVVVAFVSWEVLSRTVVDPFWIARPSAIASRLYEWVSTGYIFEHFWSTFQAMVLGLLIGSLVGISVGFLLGRRRFLASVVDPFIAALYSMPRIALAPLFILWFGIDLLPKVLLTAVIVFFLTFRNTFMGVRMVDRELIDVVRVMGASSRTVLRKVIFPSALSSIFVGLRLAVPYSLVGAVVAEFVASSSGLGWIIRSASGVFDTTGVFSGLMILMILGFALNLVLDWTETKTARWRSVEQGS